VPEKKKTKCLFGICGSDLV